MRLVHEADPTGRLQPVLEPTAAAALWELWAPRRRALVVHPDVLRRIELRRSLVGEGYDVSACAGPGQVACPAVRGGVGCPRFPAGVDLMVMEADSTGTLLPATYAAWTPDCTIVPDPDVAPRRSPDPGPLGPHARDLGAHRPSMGGPPRQVPGGEQPPG